VKVAFSLAVSLLVGLLVWGQEVPNGAWVDEIIIQEVADDATAVAMIEAGDLDLFAYALTDFELYQKVLNNPDKFNVAYSLAIYDELTFNVYGPEFNDGRLNPFSVAAIREAMNWLVDRDYICNEIFKGLAEPRFHPVNPAFPDYARYVDIFRTLDIKYAPNLDKAREVITREMEALGAELVDGKWYYKGEPVVIIMLIRIEDERKDIGDYVAGLLEDLGFTVDRQYKTSKEASPCWIGTDPAEGCFHIYTGGWGTTILARSEVDNFGWFYLPLIPWPLWQAYEPPPEFEEVALKLVEADYTTLEERRELVEKAAELALKYSPRIWLVTEKAFTPMREGLLVAADLATGVIGSRFLPYTIRWEDGPGGSVRMAVIDLLNEPLNPIGGSNWLYDYLITRPTMDWLAIPDPYTGLARPQRIERAEVTVQEGLPVGVTLDWVTLDFAPEIQVPADAWIDWDATSQTFVTVGEKYPEGLTAKTRSVVYYEDDFFSHPLHDGSTLDLADLVMNLILTFDRANPESPIYDEAAVPGFETFQNTFRGVRIVSTDPLVVEYYSDYWELDAENIVSALGTNYDRGPGFWHTLVPAILAEANNELAFTTDKSDTLGVEWTNYVAGPSLPILEKYLRQALEETYIPYEPTLGQYITEEEAQARYENLLNWYEEKGHFWVGWGPFYLDTVDPVAPSVVLKRFPAFPDPADKWLGFAEPKLANVEIIGPRVLPRTGAVIPVRITFKDQPYPTEELEFVKFLLFDSEGNLAYKGEAEMYVEGEWVVNLPASVVQELPSGSTRLEVVVSSKVVATPSFASITFVIP